MMRSARSSQMTGDDKPVDDEDECVELHQCVHLLKPVYGLVDAPRDGTIKFQRSIDHWEVKSLRWSRGCGIQDRCVVSVDDFMWATNDSVQGDRVKH